MKLNWRTALIIAELEQEIEALAQGRAHRRQLKARHAAAADGGAPWRAWCPLNRSPVLAPPQQHLAVFPLPSPLCPAGAAEQEGHGGRLLQPAAPGAPARPQLRRHGAAPPLGGRAGLRAAPHAAPAASLAGPVLATPLCPPPGPRCTLHRAALPPTPSLLLSPLGQVRLYEHLGPTLGPTASADDEQEARRAGRHGVQGAGRTLQLTGAAPPCSPCVPGATWLDPPGRAVTTCHHVPSLASCLPPPAPPPLGQVNDTLGQLLMVMQILDEEIGAAREAGVVQLQFGR